MGCLRHVALMHLIATNVAVWFRLVLWGVYQEWIGFSHRSHAADVIFPPADFLHREHVLDKEGHHKVFGTKPQCSA